MSAEIPKQPASGLRLAGDASAVLLPAPDQAGTPELRRRLASLSPAQKDALARRLSGPGTNTSLPAKQDGRGRSPAEGGPLSFAQERMWILAQFEPNSPVYNRPASLRLRGPLDVPALERSLNEVVRRHEVLRARIHHRDGGLTQTTVPFEPFALPVVGWAPSAGESSEDRLQAMAEVEARRLFDLQNEPPWSARLVRVAPDDHALLLTFHHAVFDGWSFAVLWDELAACYRAFQADQPPALPEMPLQYAGFAAWQRERLQGEAFSRQLAYWKDKLAGCAGVLNLPTDRPRPAVQTSSGSCLAHRLPAEVTAALKEMSGREGVTLFMALFGGLAALLQRYTNQEDLVVGVPIAGRTRLETERMIGCFINTLALRMNVSGNPTVRELLQRVRAASLEAFAHQEMPFERLVQELNVPRDLSRTPLFQVLFQLRNTRRSTFEWPGLQVKPMILRTNTAKTDLSLDVMEEHGELTVECEYNTDLFDAGTIARLLGHYEVFLCGMAGDPSSRLSELPLLTVAERHQVLVEWNQTEQDYPPEKCLHQLFEEQVERTPEAVAVVFEGQSLTYRELNARANQLAHHLRSLRVGPDVLVGLCVERSLEMVVALLGILKAGGAYLPLDPVFPRERLAFMIEDAQTPVILTQRNLVSHLPAHEEKVVCLDDLQHVALSLRSAANLENQSTPANLAYVIFTSGSTGQPKGVLITHHNVVRLMQATADWYRFDDRDVWTMFHSYGFDFSVWEIWGALLYGGKLVVVPYFVSRSPDVFYDLLAAEKVTVLNQTPSAFQQLVQWESSAGAPRTLALRYVIFGGEALDMQRLKPWFERHGDIRPQLVNMFGLTETTVHVTYRPLTKNDIHAPSVIGVPIPDLQVYILDLHRQPAPVGATGELFVGGAGLARGYLNRPKLTAERFIPNPFSSDPAARLYKTGDFARRLPDGDIEYRGRIDDQIKIRGHRIELGEIQAVLGAHPNLSACAVVSRKHGDGDKILVAFVIGREPVHLSVGSLRQWLGEKLPDYMIPSRFVLVSDLPLTPNGKVDRKALEKLDGVELYSGTDYVAPRNDRERELAEIWQAVLRRERVGVHDNFFSMGGHSLLAMILWSQITRRLSVEVPLRWVFEHPTVAGLAKQLECLPGRSQYSCVIEKANRQKPSPMSFAQQGMWLLQQTLPDPATYNQPLAWRLSGRVDRERVRRALQAILERHEVLRTALVQQGESLVQEVAAAKEVPVPWQELDLQAVPPSQKQAVLEERLLKEVRRPFDLAQAPLWRSLWIKLAEDEQVMAFTFHHSIVDEWSLRRFFQELERLYATDGQTDLARLPELPVQYADYAVWQRQRLSGELLEQQGSYWREQLRDLPPALDLPTDKPRPVRPSGRGGVHDFQLTSPVVTWLRELARGEGTTLFTVMLAAFQVWLHRYTGQTDVVVGTPITSRNRPELQSLLGFFLNTLPIRVRLEGNSSFRQVLRQVRQTLLEGMGHADLPFEQMVEMAVKEREPGQQPLYQAMFVMLEGGLPPLSLDQAEVRRVPMGTGASKNDLTLSIQAGAQVWDCQLEYAADLFSAESAARMVEHLTQLLRSIMENPRQSISRLGLMPEEERHQILVEWNRTERDYPRDKCVHQFFEEQVEGTPEAEAVVFEGTSLSYRELNIRANRLAHHLRSLGVGPDALVGLCVERSLEMVVALLGILKAGGAYVPLDPTLPQQRLAFMIGDAGCGVVITQKALLPLLTQNSLARETSPLWMVLDAMTVDLSPGAEGNPVLIAAPNHLAYVIYTSGSTGQLKGVEMPHRALVNLLHWQCSSSAMRERSRTLQFASLGFDVSFQEMLSTWMSGGTLVLVTDEIRRDPAALLEAISAERIDRVFLPFVMLEQLAETAGSRDTLPGDLKEVMVAGEQLRIGPAIRRFFDRLPGCRFWNHYGPAEAHVVTSYEMAGVPSAWPGLPSIGRPLPNCQIYLLDGQQNPVPPGVVGELHIGGLCLSRGYRQRPDLTAERFIAHPFSSGLGARLYKTGDLARWLPDGNIEFLGRADCQIKLRGFRIELGEIDAVLGGHPEVSACAVAAQDGGGGDKLLAAFVVGRAGAEPSAGSLRQWLGEKLPDYMIPSRFVVLESLPLTPNGKVDRKALEKLGGKELASGTDYVAPRNERERELVEIWQAALRRERVGVQDNFFELGGHSLLAVMLCSQIRRRRGMEVPLRWVFEHPTIEGLARQLESLGRHSQNTGAIERADRQKPLAMSFAQQGMWLLQQTLPDPATYNQPIAWHLSGQVDRERVRRALQVILERHEILRAGLVEEGESLAQQVVAAKEVRLPWEEIDLRAVPSSQRQVVLEERLSAEARRPFDLAQAPLWRAAWIVLSGDEQVLALTFHHSIVDEWSMRLFFQELERLYATAGQAESPGLPELPVQYADYAAWQRQRLAGELLERQRAYWREQLRDLPPALELPADRARPSRRSGRGAVHDFQLAGPIVTRLRELAREEGTTMFTVMLAAFQVWLHRYTGQTDMVVGTPITSRNRPELQSLLGFFLNTLPIRVRLEGSQSFREIVGQVRQTLMEAFGHADLPFEQMVELAVKEREPGQQPLYQAMFLMLEGGLPSLSLDKAEVRRVPMGTGTSKNDLTLSIQAGAQAWDCQFEYATDLFSGDSAARMVRHLTELVRSLAENPQEPISQLRLMPEEERHRILVEWNRTKRDYPRDKCVHQLFEEQVERTPEVVAVVFEGQSLTYREINARANRLAHHLRSLGVGPEVLVGLCVERSLEMVVGLLGILKAGGAYLPLDPALPRQRLAYLLSDAACTVVITQNSLLAVLTPKSPTPEISPLLVVLDAMPLDSCLEVGANLVPIAAPNHLAYVIYTSGSTGKPKGVEIPHRALVNCLCHFQRSLGVAPHDVWLTVTTLSFDIAGLEIWLPLLAGARVVIGTRESAIDGRLLSQALIDNGATILQATPTTWQMLLQSGWQGHTNLQILCGGEAIPRELADRLAVLGSRAWNLYGPTETTIWSTTKQLIPNRPVSIGSPLANTQVYVLDPRNQPMPIGVVGDLCIGGDGVARGYRNRPELTAERFVQDPFSDELGARLYRTGDLARWLPDGNIEFLGRLDQQVKIRGHRIELREVESVLGGHAEVSACAVAAQDGGSGDKLLAAFVVGRAGAEPSVESLRQWLGEKLPDYMIPSRFVLLKTLPLTPSGKVDRKALEKLGGVELAAGADYMSPSNDLESKLVEIWQAALRRERVGVLDNFFELGGHSLLAVTVQTRIEKELGPRLPLAAFFQAATVRELARLLTQPSAPAHGLFFTGGKASLEKPPLFCIQGLGLAQGLSKHLDPHWPVYGIHSPYDEELRRWQEHHQLDLTLEELAARNLAIMQRVQPHGPYCLAGFCFGGVLAFEVARQLQRQDERVALLVLLDAAYLPGLKPLAWPWLRRWAYNAWLACREGPAHVLTKVRERLEHEKSRGSDLNTRLTGLLTGRWGEEFASEMLKAYQGKPYPGSAVLFRALWWARSYSFDLGATNGWSEVVLGGVQVEDIQCGHVNITEEPYVGEAAKKIAHHLFRNGGK